MYNNLMGTYNFADKNAGKDRKEAGKVFGRSSISRRSSIGIGIGNNTIKKAKCEWEIHVHHKQKPNLSLNPDCAVGVVVV